MTTRHVGSMTSSGDGSTFPALGDGHLKSGKSSSVRFPSGSSSGIGTMHTKWGGSVHSRSPADYRGFASPRTMGSMSRNTPRVTPRTTPSRSRPRNKLPSLSTPRPSTPSGRSSRYTNSLDGTQNADGFRTPQGFMKRSSSEECIKCMLKVPHEKCEAHKYIRVGGGYRHSYWYVKAMLEEIELRRQKEALLQKRLDAIREKEVRAVKTYIRTKSGRLVERVIFMSEDDYQRMRDGGGDVEDIIKKYLSKSEAQGLQNWDREEQKAITTYVRTKSGRRVEKVIYVSKSDFDKMKSGKVNANKLLEKYMDPNDGTIEGWGEAKLQSIKTFIRTKSGRLVEKTILVSKEDYEKMQQLKREGKDPAEILNKYMTVNEGETIEGFKKNEAEPMKVLNIMVRTKSGKLVEKQVLMTEEEYRAFEESGGDLKLLRKFTNIGADDVIEDWEKASTVYDADDDDAVKHGVPGSRIIGEDGTVYEVVVDPVTGKKYKKKVKSKDKDGGGDSATKKLRGKVGKGKIPGAVNEEDPFEKGMNKEQKMAYRAGKRNEDSESEFSYRSVHSAGGTRHVMRRRKKEDGTYSDEEEYHSDQDEEGKKRRQGRRQERKVKAIKVKKEKLAKGGRNADSEGSDYSYRSVVSAGGTRKVTRRKKNQDGTYGDDESYHSSQDEEGQERRKKRRKQKLKAMKKGKRDAGSDSDFSYRSVVSAGGTRHVKRKKKNKDGTYGDEESYHSSQDEGGEKRRKARRNKRQQAFKAGKRRDDSDSDFSYRSVVSAGGTRRVRRRKKLADGTYGDDESYHSSQDEDGETRRRKRRRERKHVGSAHSYYSVVSDGGTRHVKRKKKLADGTYGDSESYHSDDSDMFDDKKRGKKKKRREHGSDSEYSYYSDVSAGGTRTRKRQQRLRDKRGRVIGHGKAEVYSSPSDSDSDDESVYKMVPDGKGGFKRVKVPKGKGKKGKGGKGGKRGGGPDGNMTDFSDSLLSTDSEDEPDLSKMTKAEKKAYLAAKEKRREAREKKRKEKYGDKYEEMVEKHKKAKEAKSVVHYEKGKTRFEGDEFDDRGIGLGHDEWGGKKKGKKKGGGDGSDADDESDDGNSIFEGRRRKKKGRGGDADDDTETLYEIVRDKDGNIMYGADGKAIMKKIGVFKKKKGGKPGEIIDSDDEYQYKYDDKGNLIRKKKGDDDPESDGDYFETAPDGTVRLKKGKKKIDINKLKDEDLRKLGLDPDKMSKQEIARKLKEMFGDDIRIEKGKQKVGLKSFADMDPGMDTDELANDSDLDTSTMTGQRKVRVLLKKGGQKLAEHMKKVIQESALADDSSMKPPEKDASIDFLRHYRLVDVSKIDIYVKPFAVEDDNMEGIIPAKAAKDALQAIPTINHVSKKQMDYIWKVLDLDQDSKLTFRMFAVMTALAERVTAMDAHCKQLLEISNLTDIERKMALYKAMFYCNNPGDRNTNYIKADSLRIELMAGGLNWEQQEYVMEQMQATAYREISFIDYLCYIPLFLSMHDKMCDNPFDMSNTKYLPTRPVSVQRDMNPLGHPLKKNTPFIERNSRGTKQVHKKADDLLARKKPNDVSSEGLDMFNKYQKLPHIIGSPMKDNKHGNSIF